MISRTCGHDLVLFDCFLTAYRRVIAHGLLPKDERDIRLQRETVNPKPSGFIIIFLPPNSGILRAESDFVRICALQYRQFPESACV